jgi:hypothetical protein
MPDASSAVRELAGGHARIVWAQQQEDCKDFVGVTSDFKLMAMDTDDGRGERAVFDRTGSFCAPMITPAGDRIIYSDLTDFTVHVVDWDGTNDRVLGPGFGCGVWADPHSGEEWVFIRPEKHIVWNSKSRPVTAHLVDEPAKSRLIWDKTNVSRNWFQLSADGTRAAAAAPWPKCGFLTLPNGEFTQVDKGCWTAMTPDNTYRMWVFQGDHRHIHVYDKNGERISSVIVNGAEGINGYEVYHPRLGNNGRLLTLTGPFSEGRTDTCPEGDTENRIPRGGRNIELYVGLLDEDFTKVERWVKATNNEYADFFGDIWVEEG